MSQLESGQAVFASSRRRNPSGAPSISPGAAQPPGIDVQLQAPGVVPQPGIAGSTQISQLLEAFDMVGGIASSAGNLAQMSAANEQFKKRQFDGWAKTQWGVESSVVQDHILEGRFDVDDIDPDDIPEHARQIARDRLASRDLDPDLVEAYVNRAAPAIASAIVSRQDAVQQILRDDSNRSMIANAQTVDTNNDVDNVIADFKRVNPDATDGFIAENVLLPAMRTAAELADPFTEEGQQSIDRFNLLKKRIGEQFPQATREAEIELDKAKNRAKGAQAQAVEERAREMQNTDKTKGTVQDYLDRKLAEKKITNTQYQTLTRQNDQFYQLRTHKRQGENKRALMEFGIETQDVAEVTRRLDEAHTLPEDDEGWISEEDRGQVLGVIANRTKVNQRRVDVQNAIANGDGSTLNSVEHGEAFYQELVDRDITGIGGIKNPAEWARLVSSLRITSPKLVQNFHNSLMSEDVATLSSATIAWLALENAEVPAHVRNAFLKEGSAPPQVLDSIDAINIASEDGVIAQEGGVERLVSEVQSIRSRIPPPNERITTYLAQDKITLKDKVLERLGLNRHEYHHATSRFIRRLDPFLDLRNENEFDLDLTNELSTIYAEQYNRMRAKGRSVKESKKSAENRLDIHMRSSVDWVKIEDKTYPMLVDRPDTMALPIEERWAEGTWEHMEELAKELGHDTVTAATPHLVPASAPGDDPAAEMGWKMYDAHGRVIQMRAVDDDGEPLTDINGDPVMVDAIYHNPPEIRKKARIIHDEVDFLRSLIQGETFVGQKDESDLGKQLAAARKFDPVQREIDRLVAIRHKELKYPPWRPIPSKEFRAIRDEVFSREKELIDVERAKRKSLGGERRPPDPRFGPLPATLTTQ